MRQQGSLEVVDKNCPWKESCFRLTGLGQKTQNVLVRGETICFATRNARKVGEKIKSGVRVCAAALRETKATWELNLHAFMRQQGFAKPLS